VAHESNNNKTTGSITLIDLFVLFFIGCLLLNKKAEFTKGSSFGGSGIPHLVGPAAFRPLLARVQLYRVNRY
jgi:hypothetical protein